MLRFAPLVTAASLEPAFSDPDRPPPRTAMLLRPQRAPGSAAGVGSGRPDRVRVTDALGGPRTKPAGSAC